MPAGDQPGGDRHSIGKVADLTVVIATYNGGDFIEEQLASICEQTLLPEHIIVTDDGSSDDTLAKAKTVLERYAIPFTIGSNPGPRGYGDNFLNGVVQVRSRYTAFSDQDDIWEREKIERSVEALERSGVVMTAHGARLIDRSGRDLGRFRHYPARSMTHPPGSLRPWFIFYGFSIVFRTELLHKVDLAKRGMDFWRYRENLSHDAWISFLGSTLGDIAFIADPLVRYRQHDRNVVGAKHETMLRRLMLGLGPAAHPLLNRSATARRWASQLRDLARREPSEAVRVNASQAASRWMSIAAVELSRHRMYARRSRMERARLMMANAAKGHYTRRVGGLGVHYIPKDILIGVLRLGEPKA